MSSTVSYTPISRAGHVEREAVPKVKRMGRPTDYDPEMIAQAVFLVRSGATDAEIAEELGIAERTLYVWMQRHPDFMQAVSTAKEGLDERVKRTLYVQAIGGSVQAQQFWLKNRKRADWNAPSDVNIVVPVTDVPELDAPAQDVRSLALAAIALIREAPDAPVIEGETRHATHTQPAPRASEVPGGVATIARSTGQREASEGAHQGHVRRSRRGPARAFDL